MTTTRMTATTTRNNKTINRTKYRLCRTRPVNYNESVLNELSLSIYNRVYKTKLSLNDATNVRNTAIFGANNPTTIRQVYEGLFNYINQNQLQLTSSTIRLDTNLQRFFGTTNNSMNLYTMHRFLAQYRVSTNTLNTNTNTNTNNTNTNTNTTNTNILLQLNANDGENMSLRTRYFTRSSTTNNNNPLNYGMITRQMATRNEYYLSR